MNKTTDKDLGLKNILSEMSKLGGARVKVGIQADAGLHENGRTIAAIAADNEYGTDRIPSRPAHANAYDNNREHLKNLLERLIKGVSDGKISASKAAKILGEDFEGKVKESIRSLREPANAPLTIELKGFDNPLIHTGQTINSIRYLVEGL